MKRRKKKTKSYKKAMKNDQERRIKTKENDKNSKERKKKG